MLKINDRVKDLRPGEFCFGNTGTITETHRRLPNDTPEAYVVIWDDGTESWCYDGQLEKIETDKLEDRYEVHKRTNPTKAMDCIVLEFDDPIARIGIKAWAEAMQKDYPGTAQEVLNKLDGQERVEHYRACICQYKPFEYCEYCYEHNCCWKEGNKSQKRINQSKLKVPPIRCEFCATALGPHSKCGCLETRCTCLNCSYLLGKLYKRCPDCHTKLIEGLKR